MIFKDFYNLGYLNFNFSNLSIFIGNSFLNRFDSNSLMFSILSFIHKFNNLVNAFHIVSKSLGRITAAELGLLPTIDKIRISNNLIKQKSFLFFCGVDLESFSISAINTNSFVVFQGSFFSSNFINFVNLVLPVPVYTEHDITYLNLEGRFRKTEIVVSPFKVLLSD